MSDIWTLVLRNRKGELLERITGDEATLRQQGAAVTTVRGQLSWVARLTRNRLTVSECKRGVWKDVTP